MRRIREARLTTVIAFLAGILIATAGTATAAKLITGKQIQDGSITAQDLSKSVRDQLAKAATPRAKGIPGAAGSTGAQGAAGAKGTTGDSGAKGEKGDKGATGSPIGVLPSGETLTGMYGLEGVGGGGQQGVSYPIPLPAKTQAAFVAPDRPTVDACAGGTAQAPRADPGWLCVFEAQSSNRALMVPIFNEDAEFGWGGKNGFVIVVSRASGDAGAGGVQSFGTWAVTAP